MTEDEARPAVEVRQADAGASRQIRASSLLLVGRFIAIGLDLATQVLIVRTLSKGDFGAFAFALSVVSLIATVSVFGLDKTMPRFSSIYDERGESGNVVGSIGLGVMTILSVGVACVLLATAISLQLGADFVETELARTLLLILLILGPIQALDSLLIGMLAVFAGPRAIFIRKYLLAPGLQLAVVIWLIATGSNVVALGLGFVVVGAIGVTIYGFYFIRLLGRLGHLAKARGKVRFPFREIYGITIPLLSTDVVLTVRTTLVIILLQFAATSSELADYRAVVPLARQNLLILNVFSMLFIPAASRLFARQADGDLHVLYWRMAHLIAVATFPIFIVSFAFAEPIAVFMFGERYATSGTILAWLALGQYFSAALGFNAITLRIYARVRYTVFMDAITVVVSALALILLIPRFGALGGAIATAGTLILQNTLYQFGLRRGTGVRGLDPSSWRVYGSIALATAAVSVIALVAQPPLILGLVVSAAASVVLLVVNRDALRLADTFPELARIPFAHLIVGRGESRGDG